MALDFCTCCGAQLTENARFCAQCGAPVEHARSREENEGEIAKSSASLDSSMPKMQETDQSSSVAQEAVAPAQSEDSNRQSFGATKTKAEKTDVEEGTVGTPASKVSDSDKTVVIAPITKLSDADKTVVISPISKKSGQKSSRPIMNLPEIDTSSPSKNMAGFDVVNGGTIDSSAYVKGSTAVMRPITGYDPSENPQHPGEQTSTSFTAPDPAKSGSGRKGALIVVAILIVVALVIVVLKPWTQTSTSQTATSTATSATSGASTAASSATDTRTASDTIADQTDVSAFDSLMAAYNKLSGFDQRIRDCAATYDTAYNTSNRTTRTAKAAVCDALKAEIQTSIDEVESLGIGTASAIYDDYQNVSRLQNDLLQRVSVLCEGFRISLQYDNPSSHTSEITAPVLADNDSSGVNKYKKDFDETYASSKPSK